MKSYKNLYPQIYDFNNLYHASRAARKSKRDRVAVDWYLRLISGRAILVIGRHSENRGLRLEN